MAGGRRAEKSTNQQINKHVGFVFISVELLQFLSFKTHRFVNSSHDVA